jgi:PiT family inorganic phosphate transporter
MNHFSLILWTVIAAGIAFDFVNGFHDAANSVATIVATRVLKPWQAVLWAAFFNVTAILFFGTGVAETVGAGLVQVDSVTPAIILSALLGATSWGIITWRFGLPTSSSHGLLGAYAGAAIAHGALTHGWRSAGNAIIAEGWIKVLLFIVLAPMLGLFLANALRQSLARFEKQFGAFKNPKTFAKLQLASSAFLSLMHGANDAQKTAGIISGALLAGGVYSSFTVLPWILGLSYGMMGLGTAFGGWRIVRTMGFRLTKLTSEGGVCAETASALSILAATMLGLPISTTQVTTGAILGVGVAQNPKTVKWKVGRRIAWSWIFTIPAAGCLGFLLVCLQSKIH